MRIVSKIQITCDTPDASIYYSINNEDLNILYNKPFDINKPCIINAIGKKEGYEESEVSEFNFDTNNYQIITPEITQWSNIAILSNYNDYTPYLNVNFDIYWKQGAMGSEDDFNQAELVNTSSLASLKIHQIHSGEIIGHIIFSAEDYGSGWYYVIAKADNYKNSNIKKVDYRSMNPY